MGGTLRVDPVKLRTAAQAHADVGDVVRTMATGQSMTNAGTSMPGLLTEGACQFASRMFDMATSAVHEELSTHSKNLRSAADRYHQTDEELGRRLSKIAK